MKKSYHEKSVGRKLFLQKKTDTGTCLSRSSCLQNEIKEERNWRELGHWGAAVPHPTKGRCQQKPQSGIRMLETCALSSSRKKPARIRQEPKRGNRIQAHETVFQTSSHRGLNASPSPHDPNSDVI